MGQQVPALTTVKPGGSANLVQNLGKVGRVSTSADGTLIVSSILRSNDVPNLPLGRLFVGTNTNTSLTSDVVYIDDANDRVGIGTTGPGSKLEVVSPTTDTAIFRNSVQQQTVTFGSTTNTDYSDIILKTNSGQGEIFKAGTGYTSYGGALALNIYNSNGAIAFHPNNIGNAMFIATTGNVGIGTTSPGAYKLNVSGTGYYSGQLTVDGFTNNSGISFRDGYNPTNVGIRAKAVGTANRDGLELLGYNGIDFTVNNGANIAMRIVGVTGSGMGNVGIGTTSPTDKLTVNGNLSIFENKIYNGSASNSAGVSFPSSTTRIDGYNGITFHSSQTTVGSQTERMRISADGNVGIGTTSPTQKLEVDGVIESPYLEYKPVCFL